jgi:hypothetical protein
MYWQDLARKHKQSGILVDTNLLLLLLIGTVDERCIGGKRTEDYTVEQYRALADFLKDFKTVITTPHILAEVSNLGGAALYGKLRQAFFLLLSLPGLFCLEAEDGFVQELSIKRQSVEPICLVRLGLTDAVIAKLCEQQFLFISDDFDLVNLISAAGGDAINFSHVWNEGMNRV